MAFQPTLPARGATQTVRGAGGTQKFQPTLPARGATQAGHMPGIFQVISTHAPRTGSDHVNAFIARAGLISTHAPRTGSDGHDPAERRNRHDFNPRSPHGERLSRVLFALHNRPFQPTLPARGATNQRGCVSRCDAFQPTLPARGATCAVLRGERAETHFNPRSPHGERRCES